MKRLTLTLSFLIAAAGAVPAVAEAKAPKSEKTTESAGAPVDKAEEQKLREHRRMRDHINKHVTYPATKADLLKACRNFSDVKASDRQWFEETLPSRTYSSAEEVEKALGWDSSTAEKAGKK